VVRGKEESMQWRGKKKAGSKAGARKDEWMNGNGCGCVEKKGGGGMKNDDSMVSARKNIHIVLPGYEGDRARVIYSPAVTRDRQNLII
jgi:hypothetical protein